MSKKLTKEEALIKIQKKVDELNNLKNIIDEYDLSDELKKIKSFEDQKALTTPKKLSKIDWSDVIIQAESIMDDINSGKYHEDNDNAHYIYESVMQSLYGKDFFKWFNKFV